MIYIRGPYPDGSRHFNRNSNSSRLNVSMVSETMDRSNNKSCCRKCCCFGFNILVKLISVYPKFKEN